MNEVSTKQVRDAVITIDKFIQENLYSLDSRTVDKWFDTKMEIDRVVKRDAGKSVYGKWD